MCKRNFPGKKEKRDPKIKRPKKKKKKTSARDMQDYYLDKKKPV